MKLLKMCDPQIQFCLSMIRHISLKLLHSLTTSDIFGCLGRHEVTHPTGVQYVTGSIIYKYKLNKYVKIIGDNFFQPRGNPAMIFTTTTVALRNYKLLSLSGGLLDHNDLGVRVAHGVYAGQGTWRRGIYHIVIFF